MRSLPGPGTPEFWEGYAEPLFEFLGVAINLANATEQLSLPRALVEHGDKSGPPGLSVLNGFIERVTVSYSVSRSKNGRSRTVLLNSLAIEALGRARHYRRPDNPHVFPADNRLDRVGECRKTFARAKKRAKVQDDLRLHDLRHSFASLAVDAGVPLLDLSKLLGHRDARVTQRYVHLRDEKLRQATDAVALSIGNATDASRLPVH